MWNDLLRLALADAAVVFGSFIALWFISMAVRDSGLVDIRFAPALMTWSILGMMGKALLERRMLKKRPDYQAYIDRTNGFFPWPPGKPRPRQDHPTGTTA